MKLRMGTDGKGPRIAMARGWERGQVSSSVPYQEPVRLCLSMTKTDPALPWDRLVTRPRL